MHSGDCIISAWNSSAQGAPPAIVAWSPAWAELLQSSWRGNAWLGLQVARLHSPTPAAKAGPDPLLRRGAGGDRAASDVRVFGRMALETRQLLSFFHAPEGTMAVKPVECEDCSDACFVRRPPGQFPCWGSSSSGRRMAVLQVL